MEWMKEELSPLFAPACLLVRDNSAAHLAGLRRSLEQRSPGTQAQAGHSRGPWLPWSSLPEP